MAIIDVSAIEFDKISLGMGHSKSKYPWYTKDVGEGFFVPRDDFPREEYRPIPPRKLVEAGQVWKTAKGYHPDIKKYGIFVKRIK